MDADTQAKCRVIAEFEGYKYRPTDTNPRYSSWHNPQGFDIPVRALPDYSHDLNATMRAARRLPVDALFTLQLYRGLDDKCVWAASIRFGVESREPEWNEADDPARAAFECLYEYLAAQRKEKP